MEWLRLAGLSITMIAIGFFVLKVVFKRSFSEMSTFQIFLLIMLTHILSEPIRTDHFAELIIPAGIITATAAIYSYLLRSNKWGRKLKEEPIVLVRHGNIDEQGLNKAKITLTEMLAELRYKGFSHVKDVEFAILEETGKMSVIPNSSKRPLTPNDISYVPGYEGLPVPLIIDGVIQYDNLAKINLSPEQLFTRLSLQGYSEEMIKTISLAVLDEKNNLIIDQNDDTNQGNIPQDQQRMFTHIYEDTMQVQKKEPEDQDLGIVDDYIKPQ
ncbi:MAG: DUF421 domain-containing protein [Tepidibacillus sp.]